VVGQVDDVERREDRKELLGEDLGVAVPEPEGDRRSHVAEDGVLNLAIELSEVLMREHQPHAVLAQFREHGRERERREVVELVEVHEEVGALILRTVGAAKGRPADACHEESAQESGAVAANTPLGEIHQEDLALVHDGAQVDRLFVGEHPTENRVREEGANLVLDRCDGLRAQVVRVPFVLFDPESSYLGIPHLSEKRAAERLVGKERGKIGERGTGLIEECEERVAQNVLKAGSPRVLPLALEDVEEGGGRERPPRDGYLCERVEPKREIRVRRIEEDHAPQTLYGYRSGDLVKEITMGIEQGAPVSEREILLKEGLDEGGLARAGLANDIHVGPAVGALDTEDLSPVVEGRSGKTGNVALGSLHARMIGVPITPAKTGETAASGRFPFLPLPCHWCAVHLGNIGLDEID
jgi:hypothetical protein